MSHYPVMLPEVLEAIRPADGETYVDGTFGAGGYTRAILQAADCKVIAIDRDPDAQKRAQDLRDEFGDRFEFKRGCFGDVQTLLAGQKVDGFVLDLGVSSFQLDEAERGFSFRFDGPLDMRMDPENGQSAADIVNTMDEEDLANLIYKYGEERKSRWVAKRIVSRRKDCPFSRTADLADIVRSCVPKSRDGIDPATRTFQALRIAVNDELGEVERALDAGEDILNEDGRFVVVTFHSLEDRLVKQFFKEKSGRGAGGSRYMPDTQQDNQAVFQIKKNKPILPSEQEIKENPRSRSAKLRCATRLNERGLCNMKRYMKHIVVFVCVALSGVFLLYTSQAVQKSQRDLRMARAQIDKETETIDVLRAEWAFLSAPARLEHIAHDYLDMDAAGQDALIPTVETLKKKEPSMHNAGYQQGAR